MASQDARLSKFEADFKQQQSEMTNKIDIVLKAITDQIAGTLPSDTVKNPKLGTHPVLSARMSEKNLIYGGMLVTRIARSFGLLTDEWRSTLSVEPQPHVFKKKSLIAMGVIMRLYGWMCVWPKSMAEEEEDDGGDDEGAGGDAGQGEAEGSADLYRNMSQGDWQVHQAH
ncbi:hypothetical protein Tco_1161071 [Tanacetum coccineum]